MAGLCAADTNLGNGTTVLTLEYRPEGRKGDSLSTRSTRREGDMVETGDPHMSPDVYRAAGVRNEAARPAYHAPKLTVYGNVRDLTLGVGIGKPDNGVTATHQFENGPPGHTRS
jgi:hypothetical protein